MPTPTCDAQTLVTDGLCLVQGMSQHQLLAYIAYQLAINASQAPTPENLTALGRCVSQALGDRQLLAAIAYFQCEIAG